MDKRSVETLEFIRSQFNYTEQELKEKPVYVFFDILERANKKVEQMNKTKKSV